MAVVLTTAYEWLEKDVMEGTRKQQGFGADEGGETVTTVSEGPLRSGSHRCLLALTHKGLESNQFGYVKALVLKRERKQLSLYGVNIERPRLEDPGFSLL